MNEVKIKLSDIVLNPQLKDKQYTAIVQMDLVAEDEREAYISIFDKLQHMYDGEPGPMCLKSINMIMNRGKVVASFSDKGKIEFSTESGEEKTK
mgnify:CR=1 FL=1